MSLCCSVLTTEGTRTLNAHRRRLKFVTSFVFVTALMVLASALFVPIQVMNDKARGSWIRAISFSPKSMFSCLLVKLRHLIG